MLESEQVSEHLIILLIQYICKMLENENNILSHNNTSNSIHLLDARE